MAPDHAEGGSAEPRGAGGRPASAHTASGTRQRTGMGTHVERSLKCFDSQNMVFFEVAIGQAGVGRVAFGRLDSLF